MTLAGCPGDHEDLKGRVARRAPSDEREAFRVAIEEGVVTQMGAEGERYDYILFEGEARMLYHGGQGRVRVLWGGQPPQRLVCSGANHPGPS